MGPPMDSRGEVMVVGWSACLTCNLTSPLTKSILCIFIDNLKLVSVTETSIAVPMEDGAPLPM